MAKTLRILLVDDDENTRKSVSAFLAHHDYQVNTSSDGIEALEYLKRGDSYHIVLTDYKMPRMDGMEVTKQVRSSYPDTAVVIMTAYGTIKDAVEAMKIGAYDYLTKPLNQDELLLILAKIQERFELTHKVSDLTEKLKERYSFENIVGESEEMQKVYKLIMQAAQTDANVLITGETGTGKGVVARAIHYNSARRDGPLVELNCAALSETLIESELFGHVKGSFTGAIRDHVGKIELAHKGTFFLDEIGSVSLPVQAKLLKVLEEKSFERVGDNKTITVDIRIITSTNEPLEEAIETDKFRQDLFYRLNVIRIMLPPLRSRRGDIPLLAEYFLKKYSREADKHIRQISPTTVAPLLQYSWKGNVRELENVIESMVTVCEEDVLLPEHLPLNLRTPQTLYIDPVSGNSLDAEINAYEKHLIIEGLKRNRGNVTKTAEEFQVPLRSFWRRLEKHTIDKSTIKNIASA